MRRLDCLGHAYDPSRFACGCGMVLRAHVHGWPMPLTGLGELGLSVAKCPLSWNVVARGAPGPRTSQLVALAY
jgi:hypothetical protein